MKTTTTTQLNHGQVEATHSDPTAETATLMSNDSPSGTVEPAKEETSSTQEKLESQVKAAYAELESLNRKTLAGAIELGGLLHQLKRMRGHGNWTDYLEKTLKINPRTARDYMMLAKPKHQDELEPVATADLSITSALRTIRNGGATIAEESPPLTLANGREFAWQDGLINRTSLMQAIGKITPDSDDKDAVKAVAKKQAMIVRVAKAVTMGCKEGDAGMINVARETLKAVEGLLTAEDHADAE